MRNLLKKVLSIALSIALFAGLVPVEVFATDNKIIHSGFSGDLKWSIKENGEFILEGDGDLGTLDSGSFYYDKYGREQFVFSNYLPWKKYSEKIVHAKIRVKNAKSLAGILGNCYNLETVDFTGSDTSKTIDFACMFRFDVI